MKLPAEAQWCRVEEIAAELGCLPPHEAAARLAQLERDGEPRSILTLLESWRSLPALTAPTLTPGTRIGRSYTLSERIGTGGMGVVWRARQDTVEREVAVKLIHPSFASRAVKQRFHDEVRLLGQLDHPGIVRIFDAGIHSDDGIQDLPFYVMELVDGWPLKVWARENRENLPKLLHAMTAVCEAVQSAHDRRIVHRDLKPANILVRRDGRPVVLDFGIARLVGREESEEVSGFVGTPHYAAPEQFTGRDRDFRSGESVDVYALGAVLFEVLTGRRLVEVPPEATFADLRRTILEEPIPSLASSLPGCPVELDDVVTQATRRDPVERFYSVASLGRALSRIATTLSARASASNGLQEAWRPAAGAVVPGTRWQLGAKLGEGGTGEVWAGRHLDLGERRVFKFCNTEEKARTLKREFTLFRLLKERVGRNPHFVQLHEVSLDEPPWYLMMEQREALDLPAWVESQPDGLGSVPMEVRLEVVAQAAEALQCAHEAGILHRDVKPANLLVQQRDRVEGDPTVHVVIADFGLGQVLTEPLMGGVHRYGFTHSVRDLQRAEVGGTLKYLAPEVLEGQAATARSDIYSLGVVLWQLTVGNLDAALDPAEWASRVSEPLLREDLHRCLAGSPERRWSSAGELAVSLRTLPARREAERRRREELAARERAAYHRGVLRTALLAALVLLLLGSIGTYAWIQSRQVARATADAERLELSDSVGRLGALVQSPGLGNLETARAILDPTSVSRRRTDGDRLSLANAFVRLLESADWQVTTQLTRASDFRSVKAVAGDPHAGRYLRWVKDSVEWVESLGSPARPLLTLPEDSVPALALASRTGIAAVSVHRSLHLVDSGTRAGHRSMELPAQITALAWDPAGSLLATGRFSDADDGSVGMGVIELRRGSEGALEGQLERFDTFPFSRAPDGLCFSPGGDLLLDWSHESLQAHVWEVSSRTMVASAYHPAGVRAAAWISGTEFLTATGDGRLQRWLLPTGGSGVQLLDEPVSRYPPLVSARSGPLPSWTQLALTGSAEFALALDEFGRLFTFDLGMGFPPAPLQGGEKLVAIGAGVGGGVVLYSEDGSVREISRRESEVTFQVAFPSIAMIEDFDVSPDGSRFACGGQGGIVLFEHGSRDHHALESASRTKGIRFLDRDRILVSSRLTNQLLSWGKGAPESRAAPWISEGSADQREAGYRLAMDPGREILAAARAGSVGVGGLGDGRLRWVEPLASASQINGLEFSRDGRHLAWVDQDLNAYVWRGPATTAQLLADRSQSVAWVGTRWCCVAGPERGLWAFEIAEGTAEVPVRKRRQILLGATELAVAPEGGFAAVVLGDGIQLGILSDGEEGPAWRPLVTLGTTQGGGYRRPRFAGGGRWLGALSGGARLHFWRLHELLRLLRDANCVSEEVFEETRRWHVPATPTSAP